MKRKLVLKSFSRHSLANCQHCPFEKNNKVWGEGNFEGLCFLGESAGKNEDRQKRPFVGIAGELLTKGLTEAGIDRYKNWVTNIINGRPPENNFHHISALKARECCSPGLKSEVNFLVSKGVRVLVPLGRNACKSIGLEFESIGKICGRVYRDRYFGYNDLWVIPNYHPSYIARDGGENSSKWDFWVSNFRRAKEFVEKRGKRI